MGVLHSFAWNYVKYANIKGFHRDSHECKHRFKSNNNIRLYYVECKYNHNTISKCHCSITVIAYGYSHNCALHHIKVLLLLFLSANMITTTAVSSRTFITTLDARMTNLNTITATIITSSVGMTITSSEGMTATTSSEGVTITTSSESMTTTTTSSVGIISIKSSEGMTTTTTSSARMINNTSGTYN